MDVHRTGGITGQFTFGDGDAVVDGPFLTAHVEQQEGDTWEFFREIRDEIVQTVQAADSRKRRITLRRIAECDGAVALQFSRRPARHFSHHAGMRDDGEPTVFVFRFAGVVLFDPVGLDDDPVSGRDEVSVQFERVDRGLNLLAQSISIVIAGLAAEDGDFGSTERRRGERVHRNAEYLRAACSLCNAAAALESPA